MKTIHSFRAIILIVGGLVLVLNLALSWAATNAEPPETNYRLSELIIYNDDGNSRQVYTYDDCDNLASLLEQSGSGDLWVDIQLSTYTYDGFGNVLTKSVEHIQDGYTELFTFTRDCNGNVLTELHEYVGSDYAMKTTYDYDCDGHILSRLIQETYDYIEWYDYELYTYTYDEDGNVLVETNYITWWSGEWDEFYYEKYTYDENGNQLSDLTQYWALWEDPPTLENDWLTTATYDENGHMLYYIGQFWGGDGWYNSVKETYTYDSEGRRLSDVTAYWNWQDEAWQEYEKVEWEYLSGQTNGYGFQWIEGAWISGSVPMKLFTYNEGAEIPIWWLNYGYLLEATLYTSPQLSAEACPAQTVYYGYPPMECATVCVSASGGAPPYSYLWDNGETSQSFVVCPTETTDYSVIITDDNGCMVQACTKVEVIDVRCGNNMDKVELCHCPPGNPMNCQTICVAQTAVPAHLAHGDLLGACGIDRSCVIYKSASVRVVNETIENEIFLKVYPNPANQSTMVSYLSDHPGKVRVMLSNSIGQIVNTLFEGDIPGGEIQDMEINLGNLQPGVYVLILQQSNGNVITEKLMIQK